MKIQLLQYANDLQVNGESYHENMDKKQENVL